MSPRILRICRRALSFPGLRGFNTLYISYLPLFGRFAAEVSANPSYFCCPVRTPRVRRPVCGHPGEPFRSVDPDCFYGSSRLLSGLPAFRVSSSACGLSRCGPLPPRIFFGPFCVRALSGHSGSFFPALCGGTVSVSLRDGCAVFPSSFCSDAEYSAIPSSFLLSGSKPACPGSLRILS